VKGFAGCARARVVSRNMNPNPTIANKIRIKLTRFFFIAEPPRP